MTPQQLIAWRERLGLNQIAAAKAIGVSPSMLRLYEHGKRYDDGRPVVIPKTVALACAAVALGLSDYPD